MLSDLALLFSSVLKAFAPEPPVAEVCIAPRIRKLLVRLEDGFTRKKLESLAFDSRAMLAAHDGSLFRSVVLTCRELSYSSSATGEPAASPTTTSDAVAGANSGSSTSSSSTCSLAAQYAFYSRNLAPWLGIDEDPVTGAAHTLLAPFWSARGLKPSVRLTGSDDCTLNYFPARQCSRRGGDLLVACDDRGRVRIVGRCRLVLDGKFYL